MCRCHRPRPGLSWLLLPAHAPTQGCPLSRPWEGRFSWIRCPACSLINYAPPMSWTPSTAEQQGREQGGSGPLLEILFLFLTGSMLLLPCHLVPFFPIYCFAGCVADSSFLPPALCFLLPCFCLRGLPTLLVCTLEPPAPLSPLSFPPLSAPLSPGCRQTPLSGDVLLHGALWLSSFSSDRGLHCVCSARCTHPEGCRG